MRLTKAQSDLVAGVLERFEPSVIYIFGSFGTPFRHPDSDVDIAFLSGVPSDAIQVFEAAANLSEKLGVEVDLTDLRKASSVLRKEVLRTGEKVLLRDPGSVEEFEMRVLSDYARLNEERRECLATHT